MTLSEQMLAHDGRPDKGRKKQYNGMLMPKEVGRLICSCPKVYIQVDHNGLPRLVRPHYGGCRRNAAWRTYLDIVCSLLSVDELYLVGKIPISNLSAWRQWQRRNNPTYREHLVKIIINYEFDVALIFGPYQPQISYSLNPYQQFPPVGSELDEDQIAAFVAGAYRVCPRVEVADDAEDTDDDPPKAEVMSFHPDDAGPLAHHEDKDHNEKGRFHRVSATWNNVTSRDVGRLPDIKKCYEESLQLLNLQAEGNLCLLNSSDQVSSIHVYNCYIKRIEEAWEAKYHQALDTLDGQNLGKNIFPDSEAYGESQRLPTIDQVEAEFRATFKAWFHRWIKQLIEGQEQMTAKQLLKSMERSWKDLKRLETVRRANILGVTLYPSLDYRIPSSHKEDCEDLIEETPPAAKARMNGIIAKIAQEELCDAHVQLDHQIKSLPFSQRENVYTALRDDPAKWKQVLDAQVRWNECVLKFDSRIRALTEYMEQASYHPVAIANYIPKTPGPEMMSMHPDDAVWKQSDVWICRCHGCGGGAS